MSREYIVQGENLTLANQAVTLVHINPPAGRAIEIVRAWCSQSSSTTSLMQRIQLGFKASVHPTLVGTTPEKTKPSDPISYITSGTAGAQGNAGVNASVEGAGTFTTKVADSFNILQGYLWLPSSALGETFILSGADSLAFAMRLPAAAITLSGWNFGVAFREIG